MNMLKVNDLHKSYQVGKTTYEVLKGVSFEIKGGEFVAVMGPSGSGKTTLLNCISCYIPADKGSIMLGGTQLASLSQEQLAQVRNRELGFVFQDFYLLDSLNVRDNILLPMILDKANSQVMKDKVAELAGRFGIDHLLLKAPYELSGGEKQRAAICRALINDPELILADEPTGNLDSRSGQIVMDALKEINEDMHKTIIMVTHDPYFASLSKRVVLLKDGKILDTLLRQELGEGFYQKVFEYTTKL